MSTRVNEVRSLALVRVYGQARADYMQAHAEWSAANPREVGLPNNLKGQAWKDEVVGPLDRYQAAWMELDAWSIEMAKEA